jgi:hypothetical protein
MNADPVGQMLRSAFGILLNEPVMPNAVKPSALLRWQTFGGRTDTDRGRPLLRPATNEMDGSGTLTARYRHVIALATTFARGKRTPGGRSTARMGLAPFSRSPPAPAPAWFVRRRRGLTADGRTRGIV